MKKNKMMRLASVLLVCVLLTTSVISGTFAKYTTTGTASDTARVAKFGVAITTSGALYSDAYAKATNVPAAWSNVAGNSSTITVVADTQNVNIVAPGTKSYGNGMSFGVTGKPEVAVNVTTTIEAEDVFLAKGSYAVLIPATVNAGNFENIKDGLYIYDAGAFTKVPVDGIYSPAAKYYQLTTRADLTEDYFPVEYSLTGSTNTGGVTATASAIATQLAKAVNSGAAAATAQKTASDKVYHTTYTDVSKVFDANTDLADNGPKLGNENLTWEWRFENGSAPFYKDAADTILGDLIAARGVADPGYFVVSLGAGDAATILQINNSGTDYTVSDGVNVVANLYTQFEIALTVTQVD